MMSAALVIAGIAASAALHWLLVLAPWARQWIAALAFVGVAVALGVAVLQPAARDQLRRGAVLAALLLLAGGALAWI